MTTEDISVPKDKILNIAPERRSEDRRKRNSPLAEVKVYDHSVATIVCSSILGVLFLTLWVMGVVLSQGWMKLVAIFFFPYSWYLVCERFMVMSGWI